MTCVSGVAFTYAPGRSSHHADNILKCFSGVLQVDGYRDRAIAIDVIDGDQLCELLKENSLGVKTEMIEHVQVNSEWLGSLGAGHRADI